MAREDEHKLGLGRVKPRWCGLLVIPGLFVTTRRRRSISLRVYDMYDDAPNCIIIPWHASTRVSTWSTTTGVFRPAISPSAKLLPLECIRLQACAPIAVVLKPQA
jgi:hypothetical protein